ncbi:hypothetical protein [Streptosporangium sp. NPDC002607]
MARRPDQMRKILNTQEELVRTLRDSESEAAVTKAISAATAARRNASPEEREAADMFMATGPRTFGW